MIALSESLKDKDRLSPSSIGGKGTGGKVNNLQAARNG
jgi:hypothetical protein